MSQYCIFDPIKAARLTLSLRQGNISVRPSSAITSELAELIRKNKAVLVKMLERSMDLPACRCCSGQQVAVQTFDGYENFECIRCGICSGCRPSEDIAERLMRVSPKVAKTVRTRSQRQRIKKTKQPNDKTVRTFKQESLFS